MTRKTRKKTKAKNSEEGRIMKKEKEEEKKRQTKMKNKE